MGRSTLRPFAAFLLAGALASSLAAGAGGSGSAASGSYVGTVKGTSAFVAVVVGKQGGVLAYVCDSKQIAEWFKGVLAVSTSGVTLRSSGGYQIQIAVSGSRAAGTVLFPGAYGARLAFSASRAKQPAGLYRSEKTVKGKRYLGGWIVLGDGRQRGAVKVGSSIVASPVFKIGLAVSVPGAGQLRVGHVEPEGL